MRKLISCTALLLSSSLLVFAEGTRTWTQTRYEEFEKGTPKGVAISSDGILELSPALKQLTTTPSTYIWKVVSDSSGNAYVAAGSPARVYKVTPSGEVSIIFEPTELQVQALLMGRDGNLYAATSPDGKVYKIVHGSGGAKTAPKNEEAKSSEGMEKTRVLVDSSYTSTVFYDPGTKYIWDLAQDNDGRLYVATGDNGQILRVERNGNGSLFFKSDEAHIRALAFDPKGNLIAGSDGSGLVYRISPNGDAFVLYSAPKKEITTLAIDKAGNIYAASVGDKRSSTPGFGGTAPISIAPITTQPTAPSLGGALHGANGPTVPPTAPTTTVTFNPFGVAEGSEIYRIAPDGSPKRIWKSNDEMVYALGFDQRGRLVAGTGNKGRIFVVGDDNFVDLGKASANQVTGLAPAPNGGLYVVTSNLGKLFVFGGSADADGTFDSDVLDAKIFSRWGRAVVRGTGNYELFARSGNVDNPDRNWSEWKKVDLSRELPTEIPPARFVQWRVVLHPGNPPATVDSVIVNYLSKNVAPEVESVYVQPGAKFPSMSRMSNENTSPVTVGPSSNASITKFEAPVTAIRDRGSIAVRWDAHDDNDDDLVYSVYYRGDNETRWKLLKDDLTDKFYSFDSSLLPDGGYTILVQASDAPSHTPEDALTGSKESARFEIDSTPPQVVNLTGGVENGAIHITFRAIDGFSPIARAEYSVDAGDWHVVEPVGQISDYRVENYDFNAALPNSDNTVADSPRGDDPPAVVPAVVRKSKKAEPAQEHVIVVRVYDRYDNMGASKTVIRGK